MSGGGESSKRFLGSFVVVFLSPGFDDRLGVTQADKPVFVQAFVAEASIERLDVSILIRFSWLNLPQLNTTLMRPVQHGAAAEFLAVVGADHARQAPFKPEPIQYPGQWLAADCSFWNNGHRFVRGIIHDRQAFDDLAIGRAVEHEIHRPDLVRLLGA